MTKIDRKRVKDELPEGQRFPMIYGPKLGVRTSADVIYTGGRFRCYDYDVGADVDVTDQVTHWAEEIEAPKDDGVVTITSVMIDDEEWDLPEAVFVKESELDAGGEELYKAIIRNWCGESVWGKAKR